MVGMCIGTSPMACRMYKVWSYSHLLQFASICYLHLILAFVKLAATSSTVLTGYTPLLIALFNFVGSGHTQILFSFRMIVMELTHSVGSVRSAMTPSLTFGLTHFLLLFVLCGVFYKVGQLQVLLCYQ